MSARRRLSAISQPKGARKPAERLHHQRWAPEHQPPAAGKLSPPPPPLVITPVIACNPDTDMSTLWLIAREYPHLRKWLIANPKADAALLEYVSQAGGPGVREAFDILFGQPRDDRA